MAGGIWRFLIQPKPYTRVYHYIQNQKEHHKKKTFRQEYIEMLEKFDIDYDERYIFKEVEY